MHMLRISELVLHIACFVACLFYLIIDKTFIMYWQVSDEGRRFRWPRVRSWLHPLVRSKISYLTHPSLNCFV